MKPETLSLLNEQWLIRRLGLHGRQVDRGVTTTIERIARMREAIREVGPSVIVGHGKDGLPMNYEQAFERLYGVPFKADISSKTPVESMASELSQP